jgi:hypothetical protein
VNHLRKKRPQSPDSRDKCVGPPPDDAYIGSLSGADYIGQLVFIGLWTLDARGPTATGTNLLERFKSNLTTIEKKHRAISILCRVEGHDLGTLIQDPVAFNEMWQRIVRFEASLRPRNLVTYEKYVGQLIVRWQAYRQHSEWTDNAVYKWARPRFGDVYRLHEVLWVSEAEIDVEFADFRRHLPAEKLRSYDKTLLEKVCGNFISSHAVVEDNDAARAFVVEINATATSRRKYPDAWIEDAVQAVYAELADHRDDPWEGYCYDVPLRAWVLRAVKNRLEDMRRNGRRAGVLDPDRAQAPPGPEPERPPQKGTSSGWAVADIRGSFPLREYLSLVLTWFEDPRLPLEVGRALIRSIEEGKGNQDPPAEHSAQLGINGTNYAGIRRKIRQGLAVITYMRHCVPKGAPDDPEDASVFKKLRGHPGYSETEESRLHRIAALARVTRDEDSIAWAVLARKMVPGTLPPAADLAAWGAITIEAAFETARLLSFHPGDMKAGLNRLTRAIGWIGDDQHRSQLIACSKTARRVDCGDLVGPCWHVAVLTPKTVNQAVSLLNVEQPAQVQWVCESIRAMREGVIVQ